jgi:hypothetical protein
VKKPRRSANGDLRVDYVCACNSRFDAAGFLARLFVGRRRCDPIT